MSGGVIRAATRGSPLARWQADHVAALLRARDPDARVELVVVETQGDRRQDVPIWELGGKGVFAKEVQLAAARPDLRFVGLRGNMATRLAKVADHDAIVVAAAALDRLGLADQIAERLPVELVLPQVGQGALAVECRSDDGALLTRLAAIDHLPSHRCVAAERSFLAELGGDCSLPAAAYATIDGDQLSIEGRLATPDGQTLLRHAVSGRARAQLGAELARHLLDEMGGRELLTS